MPDPQKFKYRAFITYSHHDKRAAEKLHSVLERYNLPSRPLLGGKQIKSTGLNDALAASFWIASGCRQGDCPNSCRKLSGSLKT